MHAGCLSLVRKLPWPYRKRGLRGRLQESPDGPALLYQDLNTSLTGSIIVMAACVGHTGETDNDFEDSRRQHPYHTSTSGPNIGIHYSPGDLVWTETLDNWVRADTVDRLRFRKTQPSLLPVAILDVGGPQRPMKSPEMWHTPQHGENVCVPRRGRG